MIRLLFLLCAVLMLASPAYAGKISARSSATTPLTGAETIGIIQGGADRKTTVSSLSTSVVANIACDGVTNDTTNLQAAITANYGKTLVLPSGNCLLSSNVSIVLPIRIVGASGSRQSTTHYGTRLFTSSAGITMLTINIPATGNDQIGASLEDLIIDGNSQASVGLNITDGVNLYFKRVAFFRATHLGTYLLGNHSIRFENCHWAINGTANTDAGIEITAANAVSISHSNIEANGSGLLITGAAVKVVIDSGTVIEGNAHHGVKVSSTSAAGVIRDSYFESNNTSVSATTYDIHLSTSNNRHWTIDSNYFAGTNTTHYINTSGWFTKILNNRTVTANKIKTNGQQAVVFMGAASTELDTTSVFTNNSIVINTVPTQFGDGTFTPAVPATTVYTDKKVRNAKVHILTAGTVSDYKILPNSDIDEQTFTTALTVGQVIDIPAGSQLRMTYTVAPTWVWQDVR